MSRADSAAADPSLADLLALLEAEQAATAVWLAQVTAASQRELDALLAALASSDAERAALLAALEADATLADLLATF